MIKSDAQRDRTLAQVEGFRQALVKVAEEKPGKRSAAIRWRRRPASAKPPRSEENCDVS
jgi:hypothetical protein